jgi:type I restriction enzyme, R subunit
MFRKRPRIPAQIRRQVAVESGHRCAVCGESWPLEFAHIIPWHLCQQHLPEDLIYLCANCHERADKERWGKETLRRYKQNPAVRRHSPAEERARIRKAVILTVEMKLVDFRERDERLLRLDLEKLFGVSNEAISISKREDQQGERSDR